VIINVELIALSSPLVGGGGDLEIDDGATLSQALDRLDLPGGETYMTIVNDTAVGPDDRDSRALIEGDAVTVFPPIKGG
jgi:sulfur carrier protein ThiS